MQGRMIRPYPVLYGGSSQSHRAEGKEAVEDPKKEKRNFENEVNTREKKEK